MESQESASKPAERRVLRRGLMAGLAGLGAGAMLKISGTGKAQATDGNAIIIGNDSQTSQSTTRLTATTLFAGPVFQVVTNGATFSANSGAIIGSGGSGPGVMGRSDTSFAVWGFALDGVGVRGQSQTSMGLYGTAASTSPAVLGVNQANSIGVKGVSNASLDPFDNGTGSGTGVQGRSGSGSGVHGSSTNGVGVRGTSPNFVGLVGISDNSIGLYGYTVAPNVPAFYAEHLGPFGRIAGSFLGDVRVQGNFTVSGGAKSAAVPMPDGSEAIMYCQESPEPYFEDFGRAQLNNGVARVQIEPEFAIIVKRDDYMVFVVAMGDCKGLYISQQNANGFEVRELQGGSSSVRFTYRIVARRKDIAGKRLERLDPKLKLNLANMRSQASAKTPPGLRRAGESPLVAPEPEVTITPPEPPLRK
jgi:hypothetical protein